MSNTAAFKVTTADAIRCGMLIGGFAPGPRTPANLISTGQVVSVHMEGTYDTRGQYAGQRVTVRYASGRVSSLRGRDTVCVVG